MNQETCTLNFDGIPLTYHIVFDPGPSSFRFLPGVGNQFAPSFTVTVNQDEFFTNDHVPETLWKQAIKKVKSFLAGGGQVF